MKLLNKILVIILCIFITGCYNYDLKEIKYKEFNKLLENKQTFILYIGSTSCSNCIEFKPKLEKIAKENKISNIKYIDLDKFSKQEKSNLNKVVNVSGTPTVVFINNGEEKSMTNRINGNISKEKIISRLKSNGYIK